MKNLTGSFNELFYNKNSIKITLMLSKLGSNGKFWQEKCEILLNYSGKGVSRTVRTGPL